MEYIFDKTNIGLPLLAKQIEAFYPGKIFDVKIGAQCTVNFEIELTSQEESDLETIVADHKTNNGAIVLERNKNTKIDQIDFRTRELIDLGFTYSGSQFSLSKEAQINATGIKMACADDVITYPLLITTLDDLTFSLDNIEAVNGYYFTGLTTKKTHIDSGRDLKTACRNATTQTELEAIVDNR
jgi:hypothetical protein